MGERRSKERFFNLSSSTVFPHAIQQLQVILQELQCFYMQSSIPTRTPSVSTCTAVFYINSIYRINSTTRNTTTTRLIPCRHLPVTVPHTSKHSTWQNKAPGSPTAFQAHMAQAGFQLILPGKNSTPSGSQHPRSPYSISQARPTLQGATWYYRILPGEIAFISKGSSIVYLCNTKVSVFQLTYFCT